MRYDNKTPISPPFSADVAARQQFAAAFAMIRSLVEERADCEDFLLSWPSEIISLVPFVVADSDSQQQCSPGLCAERVDKAKQNRDDAFRRIEEVAATFAAHESPAVFVDEAVVKLVDVFMTPMHRSGSGDDDAAGDRDWDVLGAAFG